MITEDIFNQKKETAKEENLIAENQRLRGVIADLASENLQLKKSLEE